MRATMNANECDRTGFLLEGPRRGAAAGVIAAVLALAAAADPGLGACGPKKADGKIKVTVVVILAGERPGEVDPRLKCIAEEVCKKDPALKSFRLASMTCRSLAVNQETSFKLVDRKSTRLN